MICVVDLIVSGRLFFVVFVPTLTDSGRLFFVVIVPTLASSVFVFGPLNIFM